MRKENQYSSNTEMTQVLEIFSNSFKAAMIKMFQRAFVNILETKEKELKASAMK